jgi:L-threonylcarbamoyladenylate synthase
MAYITETGVDIYKAAELLIDDELVAIPTETVYGLAGNAFSIEAIAGIYKVKQRPYTNPLIVHVANIERLKSVVTHIPDLAIKLLDAYSPGPITLLLPKQDIVPDLVTNYQPLVAIRIPDNELTLSLLKLFPFPLVAPSANKFMSISPTSTKHVQQQLNGEIPYILDGGNCKKGVESTIVSIQDDTIFIHRLGAVTIEDLRTITPNISIYTPDVRTVSPGTLSHHYSPSVPVILTNNPDAIIRQSIHRKIGLLVLDTPEQNYDQRVITKVLSRGGSLEEAARNLYSALYFLDNQKPDVIIAKRMPAIGIGNTINDRLSRAAARL